MSLATRPPGILTHRFRMTVVALTVIAIAGTWLNFLALFLAQGHGLSGGCGGMVGILLVLLALVSVALLIIATLAASGLLLLWFQTAWGPPLTIAANLLAMGFFGWWVPIRAGQTGWAVLLMVLAMTPALAAAILVRPLVTRGRPWLRVVEVVVLGALAAPMIYFYVSGISYEAVTALQPAAPRAVASCSGAAT